eukprot:11069356-Prorocentrum_lima.AAC.1
MTSSLVGSEMCIRDRPSGCFETDASGFAMSTQFAAPSGAPAGVAVQPWTCLLYTSDAADDM